MAHLIMPLSYDDNGIFHYGFDWGSIPNYALTVKIDAEPGLGRNWSI